MPSSQAQARGIRPCLRAALRVQLLDKKKWLYTKYC